MAEFNIERKYHLTLSTNEILTLSCALGRVLKNKEEISKLPNGINFNILEEINNSIDLSEFHNWGE